MLYVVPWLPAALAALYLKYVILRNGGSLVVARSAGRVDGLALIDWIALFQSDVFVTLAVIPLAIMLICPVLPPRSRGPFVGAVSIAFITLFYGNMQSYGNVGRSLSYELLTSAIRWGAADTTYIREYIEPDGLIKLVLLVAMSIIAAWWASRSDPDLYPAGSQRIGMLPLLLALLVPALYAAVPHFLANVAATPYHDSILVRSVSEFLESTEFDVQGSKDGRDESSFQFRTLTRMPAVERDMRYFGRAAGHDVVLFILETAPARVLGSLDRVEHLPNFARLSGGAIVGRRHFSTYPYSSQAHFSILSGMYPPETRFAKLIRSHPGYRLPGLMQSLRRHDYWTASYSPYRAAVEPDEEMYRAFGIDDQFIAETLPGLGAVRGQDWCTRTATLDVAALDAMKEALGRSIRQDRRYAVAFMPEIGHAPWCDVADNGANILARGRALIGVQDGWLGQIVSLLDAYGRLDKTVIVVTADHGIRTRQEDPAFQGGMIDAYSFQVPLLVYSPTAFPSTVSVPWVTSHIDIAPTLLDLLGIDEGRGHEQGSPMWNARLASRVTYFLAKGYLGADGVHADGRFSMVNHMSGAVYDSDRLEFSADDLLWSDSSRRTDIVALINAARPRMDRWLHAAMADESALSQAGSNP